MNRWIFGGIALWAAACGSSAGRCVLDTDCPLEERCAERRCVPVLRPADTGTRLDGGSIRDGGETVDGPPADGRAGDGGPAADATPPPPLDSGLDGALPMDARPPPVDSGPDCPDASGSYTANSNGTMALCSFFANSTMVTVSTNGTCDITFSGSMFWTGPGSIDSAGGITASLGGNAAPCTGQLGMDGTITLTCMQSVATCTYVLTP